MHKKLFLIALFSFILNGCLTGGSYIKDGSVEYYKKMISFGLLNDISIFLKKNRRLFLLVLI